MSTARWLLATNARASSALIRLPLPPSSGGHLRCTVNRTLRRLRRFRHATDYRTTENASDHPPDRLRHRSDPDRQRPSAVCASVHEPSGSCAKRQRRPSSNRTWNIRRRSPPLDPPSSSIERRSTRGVTSRPPSSTTRRKRALTLSGPTELSSRRPSPTRAWCNRPPLSATAGPCRGRSRPHRP